uniref:Solute-binding protein family 3/N-terminal domain-containing protein n=1 Tax=Pseudictyota dubia TaxID=2749911 RepID=A0A6U2BML0_9STRA|mmetsp:Transcript_20345/g.38265  ORF Transcript_20345/g.38265 Transcript_20345/m.38265 type:complete len:455 (+) Transcript_20345:70-1434(+)
MHQNSGSSHISSRSEEEFELSAKKTALTDEDAGNIRNTKEPRGKTVGANDAGHVLNESNNTERKFAYDKERPSRVASSVESRADRGAHDLERARNNGRSGTGERELDGRISDEKTSSENRIPGKSNGGDVAAVHFAAAQAPPGNKDGDASPPDPKEMPRINHDDETQEPPPMQVSPDGAHIPALEGSSDNEGRNDYDEALEPPPLESSGFGTPIDVLEEGSGNEARPGAYEAAGRAPGRFPAWGRRMTRDIRQSLNRFNGSLQASSLISESACTLPAAEAVVVEEMENCIRSEILANSVRAEVVKPKKGLLTFSTACCRTSCVNDKRLILTVLLIVALVIVLGLPLGLTERNRYNVHKTTAATVASVDSVRRHGSLRCDNSTQSPVDPNHPGAGMFSGDLCRAIAAAIFGDEPRVEYINVSTNDRFIVLAEGGVDVLTGLVTHTFERDVHEVGS